MPSSDSGGRPMKAIVQVTCRHIHHAGMTDVQGATAASDDKGSHARRGGWEGATFQEQPGTLADTGVE